jgi:steroid delta-isomerase-like uncharacterized protein
MTEEYSQTLRGLFEAWNRHDLDEAARYYSPDYEGNDVGEASPLRGLPGARKNMERYLIAFPDLTFTIQEIVQEGNRLSVVWTAAGTHLGSLMNIPATGRSVNLQGMSYLEFSSAGILRAVYVWDLAGVLRALGLLPDL